MNNIGVSNENGSTNPPAFPPPLPVRKTSGLAVASLVLGICSVVFGLLGIPALIFGICALSSIKRSRGTLGGRGMAIAGTVIGGIFTLVIVLAGVGGATRLPMMAREREAARLAACAQNLETIGRAFSAFSANSEGSVYPALSADTGRLMFSVKDVYSKYLVDTKSLICPSDNDYNDPLKRQPTGDDAAPNDAADYHSYVYLGYVITSEDEMKAFAKIYKERVAKGLGFDEDLEAPSGRGSMGTDAFYRLRNGLESSLPAASDATLAKIPVMWDRQPSNNPLSRHHYIGANILFLDGHVEHVKIGQWPLTDQVAQIINELAPIKK